MKVDFHVESLVCNICWTFQSLQASFLHLCPFIAYLMCKDNIHRGHTRLPCARMLPMVSQCSNPGWLVSLPIQKSTGFVRTKEHDQWNVGLMLVWKAVFLYPILVCEQCSGFSREARVHMFIIAYCLKKFTCVILELVFYNNGWVRVYFKKNSSLSKDIC